MTGRLDHIGIMVADMDAALAWYRDVFGCTVSDEWGNDETGMRWAHVAFGEVPLELVYRPGLAPRPAGTAGHHHVAVRVEDCAQTVADLESRGASVVMAPSYFDRHDIDWAFVADLDGNVFEIISSRSAAR